MTSKTQNEALLSCVTEDDKHGEAGVTLAIKAVPNASRNKIAGLLGDRLKIAVSAPPENGKANDAICKLLAKLAGVPVRDVTVRSGHTQPLKQVHVAGVSASQIIDKLQRVIG